MVIDYCHVLELYPGGPTATSLDCPLSSIERRYYASWFLYLIIDSVTGIPNEAKGRHFSNVECCGRGILVLLPRLVDGTQAFDIILKP